MKLIGSCHCGNITLEARDMPAEASQCNCSICRRYAALWAYYTPDDVAISYREANISFYSWGDGDIEYHRCHQCGCVTHYVTTEQCPTRRIALNLRMAEPDLIEGIPVRKVDGAAF